jgi:hypothetical protein
MQSMHNSMCVVSREYLTKFSSYYHTGDVNMCKDLDPNVGMWYALFLGRDKDIKFFIEKGADANCKIMRYKPIDNEFVWILSTNEKK